MGKTNRALFDPTRHEVLIAKDWSSDQAREAIEKIGEESRLNFDAATWWPTHPLDIDEELGEMPEASIYLGGAGVIWALHDLQSTGFLSEGPIFHDALAGMAIYNHASLESDAWRRLLAEGWQTRSWLLGDAGILFARWVAERSLEPLDRLAAVVAANSNDPSLELMWGAPGTMLAAVALHGITGDALWSDLYLAGVDALQSSLQPFGETGIQAWRQELYGRPRFYLGAVHGFAGNVFALAAGRHLLDEARWAALLKQVVQTVHETAVAEAGWVNWPATLDDAGEKPLLVQHCHGAPGIVTSLAGLDPTMDELLVKAGELIWHVGPLEKGAGFCHGTVGNGYAFLRLFEVSGDQLWLDRARSFAMHAIEQIAAERAKYGHGRYSLWTGDIGVACYLRDCITGKVIFPSLFQ